MWLILIIIAVVIVFVIYSNSDDSSEVKTGSSSSFNAVRDMYKGLSLGQKYAIYNFYDTLAECVTSYSAKQKVTATIRQTARELNISSTSADSRIKTYGAKDMVSNLKTLPRGAVLDSVFATAFGICSMASGTVHGGLDAKDVSLGLYSKILNEAGYSDDYIANSLKKTMALIGAFGR